MDNKYIYNRHIAPITVNARSGKGAVLFTKTFQPERIDGTTGRVVSTGYTTLTDEEYDRLSETSRTFKHYRDKLGLLVECDDLPPEAKTPQEALVDARKKLREAQSRIAELEAETEKLKAELLDAEKRYKDLFDASGSGAGSTELAKELEAAKKALDETAKANSACVEGLKKDKGVLEASLAETVKERDALKKENGDIKAALEKAGKGGKAKEFD
jgi:chromosome segregation ATPase